MSVSFTRLEYDDGKTHRKFWQVELLDTGAGFLVSAEWGKLTGGDSPYVAYSLAADPTEAPRIDRFRTFAEAEARAEQLSKQLTSSGLPKWIGIEAANPNRGGTQVKVFPTEEAAKKHVEKMVAEKRRKGYSEAVTFGREAAEATAPAVVQANYAPDDPQTAADYLSALRSYAW